MRARLGRGTRAKPHVKTAKAASKRAFAGILPSQAIETLIDDGQVQLAEGLLPKQLQPASLDLRLGTVAYRVRASFCRPARRSPASSMTCSFTP
jgi:hypothetical protein